MCLCNFSGGMDFISFLKRHRAELTKASLGSAPHWLRRGSNLQTNQRTSAIRVTCNFRSVLAFGTTDTDCFSDLRWSSQWTFAEGRTRARAWGWAFASSTSWMSKFVDHQWSTTDADRVSDLQRSSPWMFAEGRTRARAWGCQNLLIVSGLPWSRRRSRSLLVTFREFAKKWTHV